MNGPNSSRYIDSCWIASHDAGGTGPASTKAVCNSSSLVSRAKTLSALANSGASSWSLQSIRSFLTVNWAPHAVVVVSRKWVTRASAARENQCSCINGLAELPGNGTLEFGEVLTFESLQYNYQGEEVEVSFPVRGSEKSLHVGYCGVVPGWRLLQKRRRH